MAKKIALLISFVMMFSFSCVFATELLDEDPVVDTTVAPEEMVEIVEEPEPIEETAEVVDESIEEIPEVIDESSEENEVVPNEVVTSAPTTEGVSGETVSGETQNAETSSKGNGTVIGAIIAVIIVIAVVAIVSVLQKK